MEERIIIVSGEKTRDDIELKEALRGIDDPDVFVETLIQKINVFKKRKHPESRTQQAYSRLCGRMKEAHDIHYDLHGNHNWDAFLECSFWSDWKEKIRNCESVGDLNFYCLRLIEIINYKEKVTNYGSKENEVTLAKVSKFSRRLFFMTKEEFYEKFDHRWDKDLDHYRIESWGFIIEPEPIVAGASPIEEVQGTGTEVINNVGDISQIEEIGEIEEMEDNISPIEEVQGTGTEVINNVGDISPDTPEEKRIITKVWRWLKEVPLPIPPFILNYYDIPKKKYK